MRTTFFFFFYKLMLAFNSTDKTIKTISAQGFRGFERAHAIHPLVVSELFFFYFIPITHSHCSVQIGYNIFPSHFSFDYGWKVKPMFSRDSM